MRKIPLVTVMLTGFLCASSQAAPVLSGNFDISGNFTYSLGGFCPTGTECISWTDSPATLANRADIGSTGLTGVFSGIAGFSGNGHAEIFNIQTPPEFAGGAGFPPQTFMAFYAPGVTTTLLINFIAPGVSGSGQCYGVPASGQLCTPQGGLLSLFTFVNSPPGPQATAVWRLSGVTDDGQSTWVANFTSQFDIPFQTVIANLETNGSITNRYDATFTVTSSAPEPGTISMLGVGFLLFSGLLLRNRSNRER
jgi:hypothetical protein